MIVPMRDEFGQWDWVGVVCDGSTPHFQCGKRFRTFPAASTEARRYLDNDRTPNGWDLCPACRREQETSGNPL